MTHVKKKAAVKLAAGMFILGGTFGIAGTIEAGATTAAILVLMVTVGILIFN